MIFKICFPCIIPYAEAESQTLNAHNILCAEAELRNLESQYSGDRTKNTEELKVHMKCTPFVKINIKLVHLWCTPYAQGCHLKFCLHCIFLNSVSSQSHVVNRLLRENRKTIPKFLNGKKLYKK